MTTPTPTPTDDILMIEDGAYATADELAAAVSRLYKAGILHSLQGFYGRLFESLVAQGLLTPEGDLP